MELHARRQGWEIGEFEIDVDYTPAGRGAPTRCKVIARLPEHLSAEQRERLMQVGATSRVHRTLDGEVAFDESVELTSHPIAEPRDHGRPAPPRRRIALLNGLRRALRAPPA